MVKKCHMSYLSVTYIKLVVKLSLRITINWRPHSNSGLTQSVGKSETMTSHYHNLFLYKGKLSHTQFVTFNSMTFRILWDGIRKIFNLITILSVLIKCVFAHCCYQVCNYGIDKFQGQKCYSWQVVLSKMKTTGFVVFPNMNPWEKHNEM
jgi:hypothetical protein